MKSFTYLHFLTLLLFINLLQPTIVVCSFGNETDRLALLKFKKSIVTDPQGLLNSWNDSVHFCKWRGITCGRRHQRVTTLNLSDGELHGTISPYIGNLSFLKTFSLSNNNFSGKIPHQVDHLFRLRHLNLKTNMLGGHIPVNLTSCPELSIISIGFNRLTGKIPSEIGSMRKLQYLLLYGNNLMGGIPLSLANLSSIGKVSLTENYNLGGTVPEEMGRLRNLWFFGACYCNLSGMLPPSLFNMSSLKILSVTGNKFKGILPSSLGLNLKTMFLGDNELSGQIPDFANASRLLAFNVADNNFFGQVPTSFATLTELELLNLGGNNLGSNSSNDLECITFLTNCSNLVELTLADNNFGGVLPNSVANFSTNLTKLNLGCNQIVETIPETLGNLNSLILLALDQNLFTGIIPSSFGKLQNLQSLYLDSNRLSGPIPSSLGNLTQLSLLHIVENELEGSIPPTIGYCRHLQILIISQNRLSGDIPPEIIGLSSLLFLDLSQNSLTGSLHVEVSKLKNIYHLDISGNNLTGEILETIGKCESLEFLSLRWNLIQGTIPSSLASVRGLQSLDLSQNNLSGQIPKDLQRLPFLIYLNLSTNNLEGEVPIEGVFRNNSAISLDGNPNLCGGISELQLPACTIKVIKQRKLHGFKPKLIISLVLGCSVLFAAMLALYWKRKIQKKEPPTEVAPMFLSKVSYQTLHQATGGFSLSNQIGSGGFGSVYKGILDQEENSVVAIKVLNLQHKGASKSFMAECNALRNIRHRNLVKILTCCSSTDHNGNDFKALVFEYMSNGCLEEWLYHENQSRSSLNLLQRLNIVVDVASALCYLHDHCESQIIHRDLKPSNVLLNDDMVACVSDFGLARLIPATASSSENLSSTVGINGTIGYAAPEYAVGVEPSTQGDVYSYGILVLQLFTGRRPTDEMFVDNCNIHTFVKRGIQERIMQIVDPTLIVTLEEEIVTSTINTEVTSIRGYNNVIKTDEENIDSESLSKMNTYVYKCILPTLKIGVACSEESPRNRMSMEEVLRELHRIKNAYNAIDIRREKPRRS